MRVFVAGGTGFVGGALVSRLLDAGHEVTVLVHEDPGPWGERGGLTRVEGDVTDPRTLEGRLHGHEAAIHLVAIRRGSPEQFERLHTGALRNVLEAAKAEGAARFVFMSANGVKPDGTPYQRTKWESEQAVKESGLRWTIFRPSFITGPGHPGAEGFDAEFVGMARKTGSYPNFGGGRFRVQPVALADVAEAYARALASERAEGKTYPLCGPEAFAWGDYLHRLRRVSGVWRPILPVPEGLALAGAGLLERFRWFPASRDELRMLFEGNTCESGETLMDLDLKLTPYEDAAAFLRERFG